MSKGVLSVRLRSPSMFLGSALRVEVRDSDRALVDSFSGSKEIRLDPGLYTVSAVMEDGRLHQKAVRLRAEAVETVSLEAAEPVATEAAPGAQEPSVPSKISGAGSHLPHPSGPVFFVAAVAHDPPALEEVRGATVDGQGEGVWIFSSPGVPTEVPTARFRILGKDYSVSLPVNPMDSPANSRCTVRVTRKEKSVHIMVELAPGRTVARTLSRMVEAGFLEQSAVLAGEATSLLVEKYRDPVGAALGGLLLRRLGRLVGRQDWVENLARDFSWLPDGRVLLASLLAHSEAASERERGLRLLLQAAPRRMMFADGLSLALELLRRWPDDSDVLERRGVIEQLYAIAAGTRWHETILIVEASLS